MSRKVSFLDVARLTVGFKKLATILCLRWIEPGCSICAEDKSFLRLMVWHGDAWRSAILIDTSLPNDALNAIAVLQSMAQSLEHNSSYTFL